VLFRSELLGLYYDFVHEIDYQIGRILDHLEKLGIRDQTMVVLTADHGDMAGGHMLVDKGFPYEEAHHIPMILRPPADSPLADLIGTTSDQLVYNMDVYPTVLEMAGIPDESLDGCSLIGPLAGTKEPRDELLFEFHGLRALYSQRTLLTNEGRKYVFTPGDFDELYDLVTDPLEMRNLLDELGRPLADSGVSQGEVDALRDRLADYSEKAGDPLRRSIHTYYNWG